MNIVVAGGSGLLGSALITRLHSAGHLVTLLTRNPARVSNDIKSVVKAIPWDGEHPGAWESSIDGADAVINLAGESIAGKRWNDARKKTLVDSRVHATRAIVNAIAKAAKKPSVLINASAVGYYGNVPEGNVVESTKPGTDFLATLCVSWEYEALRAEALGVRVVLIRTGLVLTKTGGALAPLLPPFKMFAGGPLGSGKQWWPWVHVDDEIGVIAFALDHPNVSGPVNVSAPNPVRMKEFARVLGNVLHRPSLIPTPGFALRLLLGELADALVLSGQRTVSDKIVSAGYAFKYESLEKALKDVLGK